MAKSTKARTPAVHVFLDTNCIFTDAEDRLLSKEISDYVLSEAPKLGLAISWYLPEVVKGERRRQMYERALKLLGPMSKLERIIGVNFAVTPDILGDRIDATIKAQCAQHGLKDLELDVGIVDWKDLIKLSIERRPPFSDDKSEKGFKDALILESVHQASASLPTTAKSARLVLLTGDGLLTQAARDKFSEAKNFAVISTVSDLRTMLTAIATHLSSEDVSDLLPKARDVFWTAGKSDSVYLKHEIWPKIIAEERTRFTPGLAFTKDYSIYINDTSFVGKAAQTVTFKTEVVLRIAATKKGPANRVGGGLLSAAKRLREEQQFPPVDWAALLSDTTQLPTYESSLALPPLPSEGLGALSAALATRTVTTTIQAELTFDVLWSAVHSQSGNLTKAKFVEVVHKSTLIEDPVLTEDL